MNSDPYSRKTIPVWRRLMTAAAIALFVHAVAVHSLHTHATVDAASGLHLEGAIVAPAGTTDSGAKKPATNCPACHLQQNFFFEEAAHGSPLPEPVDAALPGSARPFSVATAPRTCSPNRGPPVLRNL